MPGSKERDVTMSFKIKYKIMKHSPSKMKSKETTFLEMNSKIKTN